MRQESGIREFPIWLLGGSEEIKLNSEPGLEYDLGPSPILGMWSPVISRIQNIVFKQVKMRIDELQIHVRNAIKDANHFPNPVNKIWTPYLYDLVKELRGLIEEYKPVFLFTFGAFPFEFAKRSLNEEDTYPWNYWTSKRLGDEFRTRLENFDIAKTNVLPLLHGTTENETFHIRHEHFCGGEKVNYFEYVAGLIAEKILQFQKKLKIWTQ